MINSQEFSVLLDPRIFQEAVIMYYEDLTPYEYLAKSRGPLTETAPHALNVGWLERGHVFPQAVPSAEIVGKLWALCRTPINATRGTHECEFCDADPHSYFEIRQDNEVIGLGHAEIWVFDGAVTVYVAPTLIYHYITAHHYAPPTQFVNALLCCPLPNTPDYDLLAGQFMWGKMMLREKDFERRHTQSDPWRDAR